jgi:hypothetical protein
VNSYNYKNQTDLTAAELFFWIAVDESVKRMGTDDLAAVIAILAGQPWLSTPPKLGGATKGTSVASYVGREYLNYKVKIRLPMITGSSISTLRIALTRNLGAFVGRTVPFVGWAIVAGDVALIIWNTVEKYNSLASVEDKLAL